MSVPEVQAISEGISIEAQRSFSSGEAVPKEKPLRALSPLHPGQRVLLSVLLMALFSEWLYPVRDLMDGDEGRWFHLFIAFTGILLLVGCLAMNRLAYVSISAVLIVGSLYFLFGVEAGWSWFTDYGEMFIHDIQELVRSRRLHGITGESRTLLLLIGWALLVGSVQMLTLGRQSILLFLSATVLYLLALEIVIENPAYSGVVRSAGWGLLLQCLLAGYRQRPEGIIRGKAPGVLVALTCVLAGWSATQVLPAQPARDISWDSIVRTVERWSSEYGEHEQAAGQVSVSGYGRDDSRLGSPLELRRQIYFTAVSPENTYWRGESKSVYTGHGWASLLLVPEELPESAGKKELIQQVIFKEPLSGSQPIFSGGTPASLTSLFTGKQLTKTTAEGTELRYDPDADALYFNDISHEQNVFGYEIVAGVTEVTTERLAKAEGADPEEIMQRELQLPVTLPERVRSLGAELTAGQENRYEAVQSVIHYLKNNYTYSLDSEVPPEKSDFTDFFLFEQKQGYCDHFSTAMTVLLRSGGIPARWVKGFAPGTPDSSDSGRYQISYADAHAWVEVYFPGEGWVSFDPTPGYETAQGAFGAMEEAEGSDLTSNLLTNLKERFGQFGQEGKILLRQMLEDMKQSLFLWASAILGAGLLLIMVMLYRRIWYRRSVFFLWPHQYRNQERFPDRAELLQAADRAWKELYIRYGAKHQGVTAREYFTSISTINPALAVNLERFITMWEILYYGDGKLDRSRSREFLDVCRQLAFGEP